MVGIKLQQNRVVPCSNPFCHMWAANTGICQSRRSKGANNTDFVMQPIHSSFHECSASGRGKLQVFKERKE